MHMMTCQILVLGRNTKGVTLAQIPDAIKQKKQELLAKVREGRAIRSSLEDIPRSAKEDKQQIIEVDASRLEVL